MTIFTDEDLDQLKHVMGSCSLESDFDGSLLYGLIHRLEAAEAALLHQCFDDANEYYLAWKKSKGE